MEVILADDYGFCYGVKRAIKMALNNVDLSRKVCTLGPIIHNPQMVKSLADKGIGVVETVEDMDCGKIIIRSHGVGPSVYEKIQAKGLELADATCPHVKKAQMSAKTLADEGFKVIIIGEKEHPEVKSIKEWAGENSLVLCTEEEAHAMSFTPRMGIVAQTTFSADNFNKIVSILLNKSYDIRILRTICTATDKRQSAAIKLAQQVDLMIVIGGRNSANTTRLAQICAEHCAVHHIETADELQNDWFNNIKKIGITAGASTPDWIIKEVYEKCKTWQAY
ncbi:MAG TPA: 4-hydroxy-3-methylbut-2-enyl diphosphate reductase [Candidatus Megamonas gallistercoris]|nr:4-hydroxy-3-methylbut-2-enyl diphosphate reductase [Candidatus Megamonas gallistercoris]